MWKTPWLLPEVISPLREQSSNTWDRSTLKRLLSLPKDFKNIHFFSTAVIATEYLSILTILGILLRVKIKSTDRNQFHFYTLTLNYLKKKLRKQSHLQLHQNNKIEINLTKEVWDRYSGNYKTLIMKEIEKDTNKWKDILCS